MNGKKQQRPFTHLMTKSNITRIKAPTCNVHDVRNVPCEITYLLTCRLNQFILLQLPLSSGSAPVETTADKCSLLGMSSGGRFSGNMRTFFIRRNSSYCFELTRCSTKARQLLYQIRHSDLRPSFKRGEERKIKRAHVKWSGRARGG